jgi:hypothetical protein
MQVAKIRHIVQQLSLEVETPEEARGMPQLKGAHAINFQWITGHIAKRDIKGMMS